MNINKTEAEKDYNYIESVFWKKCSDILLDHNIIRYAIEEFFKCYYNIDIGNYVNKDRVSREPLAFNLDNYVVTDRYIFSRKINDNASPSIHYYVYIKYFVDENNNILNDKNYIMTIYKIEAYCRNYKSINDDISDLFDAYNKNIPAVTENMNLMYSSYEFEINANMKFNVELGFNFKIFDEEK